MIPIHRTQLYLSICSIFLWSAQITHAQQVTTDEAHALPTIKTSSDSTNTYAANVAISGLKSETPLFKTAQSVSVIGAQQLEQKQASTLSDAINGIAGVSAGNRSRRGFDDIVIRGQNASNQIFIDGLRQGTAADVAIDLSGMDQVQVIKGPASVNFGQALPGGIVNLVSKWPEANSFAKADLTYGSYNFKQGQFDLNYSPNQSKDGAFRVSGRIADQHDPVDQVYFKNFFISPSYTIDLTEKARLSVIASYQHREYMRLQGLPIIGTLKPNPNGPINRSTYFGEPAFGPYKGDVYRLGYKFDYNFDNGWNFEQNFAVRKGEMDGKFVSMTRWIPNSNYTTISRRAVSQDYDNLNFTVDNQLKNHFDFENVSHHVLIGVDAMHEKRKQNNFNCNIGNFNLYKPIYNTNIDCKNKSGLLNTISKTEYVGIYLRDQIFIKDNLIVSLAGRQDWAKTSSEDLITRKNTSQNHNAFTGSASILYNLNNWISPYTSYSTSFFPTSGTDVRGNQFNPQKGKQLEAGFKFQNQSGDLQASLAWYDLSLNNVLVSDPNNNNFQIQNGQQKTQGIEAEIAANLSHQLRLNASFSHMYDAKISKDTNLKNIGQRLENTPENTYSLSMRYYPQSDLSHGWYLGTGVRGESSKPITGDPSFKVPAYALFDTEAGYDAKNWGAQLSIRNMFNKNYYAGYIANRDNENRVMALGNPRQINFTLKFKY
ncbi:TonB-dependent siderophore receptor [Acinetobacter sp. B5B]|uniref:TonB-dependent siderophore receptor n=1 Tax=Acinetobacter baretiae TaxID=2605383 RepID=UPI0018C2C510|nr:TonB-dependent siderophore receptor [Acinetobacter baretiae]MBF7684128.1 TonB-dependent siderophore receptor [Acinetobacter baretiae]MBF7684824.1 TonB-dependent siderophore receptor [Acinetobacter baretiae]